MKTMNNQYTVLDYLFNAHTGSAGHTWTLAAYTYTMLTGITRRYDPRNNYWLLCGVKFHYGVPQVWNPEAHKESTSGYNVIMLRAEAFHILLRSPFVVLE